MRLAPFPEQARAPLAGGLERYLSGMGSVRLAEREIPRERLNARGVLPETRLSIRSLERFNGSLGNRVLFDRFFNKLRVFLFDGDRPIGSARLTRRGPRYVWEHVSLGGVDEIVQALGKAEQMEGTDDHEPRLVQIPQVYLIALVLVPPSPDQPLTFQVINPPYPEAEGPRGEDFFRRFVVDDLVAEHRRIFRSR